MIRRISAGVGTVIRWSPTQRVVVSRGSVRMSCLTPVSNAVEASEDQHRPIRSGGLPPRHGLQLLQDLVEVGPEVAQNVVCVARCPVVRMKPGRGAADQHRVRQQPLQPRRRREHLLPIRRRPGGGALGQVHSSVAGSKVHGTDCRSGRRGSEAMCGAVGLFSPRRCPRRWSKAPQRQHRRKLPDETQAVRRDDKTHSQFHPEASAATLPKQHIHRHVPLSFQFRAYHSRRSVHNTPSHFRVPRASEAHTNIDLYLTDEPPQPEHGFDVSRVFKVAAPHKVHACRNARPSVDPTCSADRECRRRVKERRAALHLRTRSRIGVSA